MEKCAIVVVVHFVRAVALCGAAVLIVAAAAAAGQSGVCPSVIGCKHEAG